MPYVVDNIWEWLRPEKFPSRRSSVFFIPARPSGSIDYAPYSIELDKGTVCQLVGLNDSIQHADCISLRRALHQFLGPTSFLEDVETKRSLGVFLPSLTADECRRELTRIDVSGELAEMLRSTSTYWGAVRQVRVEDQVSPVGEIFADFRSVKDLPDSAT